MAAQTGFMTRAWSAAKNFFSFGDDVMTRRSDARRGRGGAAYDFADPFAGGGSRFNTTGSGTSLLAPNHQRLVAACRDLVRNNPHAKSAVRVLAAASVRYGITPKFPGGNKRAQAAMEKGWTKWIRQADVTGQHDFYGIMHRVDWQFWEVGEAFVRFHVLDDPEANAMGMDIPLQLEVIESEQVATDTFTAPNGNRVIAGIEVNKRGKKVAVWAYAKGAEDPMDAGVREKIRLPIFNGYSGEVLHIANPMRGNLRGDLIVSAGDWIAAARDGDRLDAPKTAAVKQAMKDWGVIETSREVVRHREEQDELQAEIVEDEPRGSVAWAGSARPTVEVRPRMSAMEELTKMVLEPDYRPA